MKPRSELERFIIDFMYRGTRTVQDFQWDNLVTVPLMYLVTAQDIEYIRKLILSPRYSGNNKLKIEKIDDVMHMRGFTKFAGGTNRLVYTHPSAPNTVFKVAIDSVGINDNPAEYRNQELLKPYCCKVFECSPCGTIASFEKVDRITTIEEYATAADDYYQMLLNKIIPEFVMEDIGSNYFMNVGIRPGFGPVLLDFPYLFELDGSKLECAAELEDGTICHGEIDYDYGFNKLVCKKCGRIYRARDVSKPSQSGGAIIYKKGGRKMTVRIMEGDKVIKEMTNGVETTHLVKPEKEVKKTPKNKFTGVKVRIIEVPIEEDEAPKTTKPVKKAVTHSNVNNFTEAKEETPAVENSKENVEVVKISINKGTGSVSTDHINSNTTGSIKVKVVSDEEPTEVLVDKEKPCKEYSEEVEAIINDCVESDNIDESKNHNDSDTTSLKALIDEEIGNDIVEEDNGSKDEEVMEEIQDTEEEATYEQVSMYDEPSIPTEVFNLTDEIDEECTNYEEVEEEMKEEPIERVSEHVEQVVVNKPNEVSDEQLIAILKASSKKKSLDDLQ